MARFFWYTFYIDFCKTYYQSKFLTLCCRLVQSTFEDLEDSGCIKVIEDAVEPMMLGSIASQYYLSYLTVSMFGSNLGPNLSLEVSVSSSLFVFVISFHISCLLIDISLFLGFVAYFICCFRI